MKGFPKAILPMVLLVLGTLASGSALADHFSHGGRVHFGISLGVPIYGPGYYPAPYYPYGPYAYPVPVYAYPPIVAAPPVYVEREAAPLAPAPAQAQNDWYYCAESRAYYPYVAQCPAGWQRVPAQPPAR